ncbi:helix-turn-helix domain-containing protein [Treponema sp. HNW]|uniref:XRE family transcriptional regulator n=1 Tax=Treponema sp. HNW TaxID=3116654 RepID=UPI003D137E3F
MSMDICIRFKTFRESLGLAQTEFAKQSKISQTDISNIERGERQPSKANIIRLVKTFNLNASWLLTGEGTPFLQETTETQGSLPAKNGSTKIPLLRQTVSCGPGQNWEESDAVESYIEPLGAFPSLANARPYAFRVRGVSMAGVGIMDGDIVLFDANPSQNLRDDIYVFALDGEVYCKLLRFDRLKKEIYVYSVLNKDLTEAELLKVIKQDDAASSSAFHLFGRVLAWMHENRLMYR